MLSNHPLHHLPTHKHQMSNGAYIHVSTTAYQHKNLCNIFSLKFLGDGWTHLMVPVQQCYNITVQHLKTLKTWFQIFSI